MAHWVFLDYMSPAGTNLIKKWSRKALTIQGRSDLEAMLSILSKQQQWTEPNFKTLSGKHLQGIGEIKFKSEQNTPLRVAGIKGGADGQYILLVGFSHKGRVYDPPDALDLAVKRKQLLANNKGFTREHEEDNGEIEEE